MVVRLHDGTPLDLAGLSRVELEKLQWIEERAFAAKIRRTAKNSTERGATIGQAYDTVLAILDRLAPSTGPLIMGLKPRYIRLVLDALRMRRREGVAAPRFFELGYGSGRMLQAVADADFAVAGIEVSSAMRQAALEQLPASADPAALLLGDFLTADLTALHGRCDVIYWNDVFEHIPTDEIADFLARIYQLLSPGGVLLTITPNWHGRPWDVTRRVRPVRSEAEGFHLKEYTLREVTALLEQAGFATVATPLVTSQKRIVLCGHGLARLKRRCEPLLEYLPGRWVRNLCVALGVNCTIARKPTSDAPGTTRVSGGKTAAMIAPTNHHRTALPESPSGVTRSPMSAARRMALGMYYRGSYPLRWCQRRIAAAKGRAPVMSLLLHRVANDRANSWTTSCAEFERQIHWLKAHFDCVSLSEAQRRIRQASNDRPCVAVTFDDGYAENCRNAIPLLIAQQIPCTYFVVTDQILHQRPFIHDAQMGNDFAPNTLAELRGLAAAGIEIGVHSRTHLDLGGIVDRDILRDELVRPRQELQDAIGRPVRYFSFPYGRHRNLTALAFQMAQEAGYEGVCSAYGGYNYPGDDAFHVQRFGVDQSLIRLKNWATVDPIRQFSIRRFDYV